MLSKRETFTPEEAARQFDEQASLFSGRMFVKLVVYADESGTHDPTGNLTGAECPVIGGYMSWWHNWRKFCGEWKAVLNRYKVPFFHFREFNDRDAARDDSMNPYHDWDKRQRDSFLYDLAEIAGKHIPVGGMYYLRKHNEVFPNDKSYPYTNTFRWFFHSLIEALKERRYENEKVSIFFDLTSDKKWKNALNDVADEFRNRGLKIDGKISFVDKKLHPHWPIQAADMIAYRDRKHALARLEEGKLQPVNVLDTMLNRNLHPNGFYPVITPELESELRETMVKFPSVKRALLGKPYARRPLITRN